MVAGLAGIAGLLVADLPLPPTRQAPWVALAQQAPPSPRQQPVFRAGAAFVRVDVYPRRDGRIVDGLTPGDFTVTEDGRPQTIEAFEYIRHDPVVIDADRRDPGSVGESLREAADPRHRLFVLFFDTYGVSPEGAKRLRPPLVEFLERSVGPTDLFGVMTPDMEVRQVTFGRRLESAEQLLSRYWTWAADETPRITPREQWIDACFRWRASEPGGSSLAEDVLRLWRLDRTFLGIEELIGLLGAIRDERKHIVLFSGGWVPRGPATELARWATGDIPQIGVSPRGRVGIGSTQPNDPDRAACSQELMRLASIDFARRLRDFTQAAVRANVSFYPLDPELRGQSGVPAGAAIFDDSKFGQLRNLARDTDGLDPTYDNDIGAVLRRMAADLSAFYLLGYYSTNTAFDGRFRRIEVRVKPPGIQVTSRRGYRAPTAPTEPVPREGAARPSSSAIDDAFEALARIRAATELYVEIAATTRELAVVAEIARGEIARGGWSEGAALHVSVQGSAAGADPHVARAAIAAGARAAIVRIPITGLPAGPWQVTLRVEGVRPLDARLDVPAITDAPVGAPVLFRAASAVQAPFHPAADRQYRRTERLRAEWSLNGEPDGIETRVLNRAGEPLTMTATVAPRSTGDPIARTDLRLAALAPGDYALEIVARFADRTERRLAAFRIVP